MHILSFILADCLHSPVRTIRDMIPPGLEDLPSSSQTSMVVQASYDKPIHLLFMFTKIWKLDMLSSASLQNHSCLRSRIIGTGDSPNQTESEACCILTAVHFGLSHIFTLLRTLLILLISTAQDSPWTSSLFTQKPTLVMPTILTSRAEAHEFVRSSSE
jgi:hypothetical protein